MAEKFTGRIAKLTGRKVPAKTAFLAVREDVRAGLDEGWPIQAIWQALRQEQRIGFSYSAFCRFVNRLIVNQRAKGGRDHDVVKDNGKEGTAAGSVRTGVGQGESKTTTGIREFKFNPVAKKEDLI